MNWVKGCIDLAPDVGTRVVHAIAGRLPDGVTKEKAWGWLLENITTLIHYAEERGVTFAFEPVGFTLVADMADLSRLIDDLREENLYINFDPSHLPVVGEDVPGSVRALGLRIKHVHMKDARILGPGEKRVSFFGVPLDFECPPLGKGVIQFGEMLRELRDIGYDGFLSVEYSAHIWGYPGDPWEAAAQSKRFMDELLAQ